MLLLLISNKLYRKPNGITWTCFRQTPEILQALSHLQVLTKLELTQASSNLKGKEEQCLLVEQVAEEPLLRVTNLVLCLIKPTKLTPLRTFLFSHKFKRIWAQILGARADLVLQLLKEVLLSTLKTLQWSWTLQGNLKLVEIVLKQVDFNFSELDQVITKGKLSSNQNSNK